MLEQPTRPTNEARLREARESLAKSGINVDDYALYFEIMEANDAPVMGNLPNPQPSQNERSLNLLEIYDKALAKIRRIYDGINLEDQTPETGIDILRKMKIAVKRLSDEFDQYTHQCREQGHRIKPSASYTEARNEVIDLAKEYGKLPAYRAYRGYGVYVLDPDEGRRGFQKLSNPVPL